jgi:opacity protein-like surface antigen
MISAAAALAGALCLSGAFAADFRAPYMPSQNDDVPVELGSGWYIRGDLSVARENQPILTPDLGSLTSNRVRNNLALGGGFGYQLNDWFRADVTGEIRRQKATLNGTNSVECPYTIAGVSDSAQNPIGIAALFNQCGSRQAASIERAVGLVNGYVDLGHWWHVTPYVGAGIGVSYARVNGTVNYYNTSDGSSYDVTTSFPSGYPAIWYSTPVPFGHINWDRSIVSHQFSLAWALMAGFTYDLTTHAKVDIGYRFINFGKVTGVSSASGGVVTSPTSTAQEVRVGLRYVID